MIRQGQVGPIPDGSLIEQFNYLAMSCKWIRIRRFLRFCSSLRQNRGVWEHTSRGRWVITTTMTVEEALERGKITQHWLDSLKVYRSGILPPGIEGESAIYYPAYLIKIDYEEVERVLALVKIRNHPRSFSPMGTEIGKTKDVRNILKNSATVWSD